MPLKQTNNQSNSDNSIYYKSFVCIDINVIFKWIVCWEFHKHSKYKEVDDFWLYIDLRPGRAVKIGNAPV